MRRHSRYLHRHRRPGNLRTRLEYDIVAAIMAVSVRRDERTPSELAVFLASRPSRLLPMLSLALLESVKHSSDLLEERSYHSSVRHSLGICFLSSYLCLRSHIRMLLIVHFDRQLRIVAFTDPLVPTARASLLRARLLRANEHRERKREDHMQACR